jgi:hypothetical protein
MSTVNVKIDKELFDAASGEEKTESCTASQQSNFWEKVDRNALDNTDLSVDVVRDLLIAKEQPSEAFVFEE